MGMLMDLFTGRLFSVVGKLRQSQVAGLTTALAGKAAASHMHAQSQVEGLVTALEGKAATSHTHTTADLPLASQEEAEAGLASNKLMTPLRVAQAVAELAGQVGGVTHLEISSSLTPEKIWLRLKEDGTALGRPRYRARGVTGEVEAEMKAVDMGGGNSQWQLTVGALVWYISEEVTASATPDLVEAWDNNYDNLGEVMTLVAVRNGDYIQGHRPRNVTDGVPGELKQLLDTDGLVSLETTDGTTLDGSSPFLATAVGGLSGTPGARALVFLGNDEQSQYVRVVTQSGLNRDVLLPYEGFLRLTRTPNGSFAEQSGMRPVRKRLAVAVVNNNATPDTLADLTALGIAVKSGVTYRFRFVIPYSAAATTTGSRWTINGPTASMLAYRSAYGLTATSETVNQLAAYNQPAAANATSPNTTRNLAIIEGVVTPSADGTLVPRFASEVGSSAITALEGAYGEAELVYPGT